MRVVDTYGILTDFVNFNVPSTNQNDHNTAGLGLASSRRKQDSTAEERAEVLRVFESITEHQRYILSLFRTLLNG